MKNKILFALSVIPFFSQAFTQDEWTGLIENSVIMKDDLTWEYDTKKLKSFSGMIKDRDIQELKELAQTEDLQISQASKYLLSLEGEKTNEFLINNYLEEIDIKNGMYYLNLNYINTPEKNGFWQYLKTKEIGSINNMISFFDECKDFKNVNELGGTNVVLNSYDDFFDKKDLIDNYTNIDLMYFEMDLMDVEEYPITVTFFPNKHVINSENNDTCLKPQESIDYVYMQKIGALYKQHQKQDELTSFCETFDHNTFLKKRFDYLCM